MAHHKLTLPAMTRRVLRRLRRRLWRIAHRIEQRHAGGEMRHPEDRATVGEWGHLGDGR
jgi:hypothetical protein